MKRDPLDKERFFEGIRQKWCAIFLSSCFAVLFVNIYVGVKFDPTPYMQFLLAIGSLFILGASGDSWVKAYSVKSIRETEIKEEYKKSEEIIIDNSLPDQDLILQFCNTFSADESYAPMDWTKQYETEEFR